MSVVDQVRPEATTAARVLVLEDHPLFLDALCQRLARLGFCVVSALQSGDRLFDTYRDLAPDLVLIDLSLPEGEDGATLTRALLTAFPGATVVVLSAYDDGPSIARCLDAGAAGFISKRVEADELADCLHMALRGEPAFDRRSARTVIAAMRSPAVPTKLTPREAEILQLIADGASTTDIARHLHLSPFTVKSHIAKILNRLEVTDRAAAVAVAIRQEIIS
jgi:DNA-binding NarL/FixJ family response regulator